MSFLVGWHYVKQGYGILIVTSVVGKSFLTDLEKRVALVNAYLCWILFWVGLNSLFHQRSLWGIQYYLFDVPRWVLVIAAALATVSSLTLATLLARKWFARKQAFPSNGVMAYATTLYAWLLLLIDPLFVFVIPACHSLQYLTVVWRYRLNAEHAAANQPSTRPFAGQARATAGDFRGRRDAGRVSRLLVRAGTPRHVAGVRPHGVRYLAVHVRGLGLHQHSSLRHG
jgi:hypothetical protein